MRNRLAIALGALAGGAAIGAAYSSARKAGLTTTDLAARMPLPPIAARSAQIAIGAVACLPAARSAHAGRALMRGAAGGLLGGFRRRGNRGELAVAVGAHALAGALAGAVAARLSTVGG